MTHYSFYQLPGWNETKYYSSNVGQALDRRNQTWIYSKLPEKMKWFNSDIIMIIGKVYNRSASLWNKE